MLTDRINDIISYVKEVENLEIAQEFKANADDSISGSIILNVDAGILLPFEVRIYATYPLRNHDFEAISFINKDLVKYDHVMGDGSICIHTFHDPDLRNKIHIDFLSLKRWVQIYYLAKQSDKNYEHILIQPQSFKEIQRFFLFTDVNHKFYKGEFGFVEISNLSFGKFKADNAQTSIVQNFKSGKEFFSCSWNKSLKALANKDAKAGIFIFIENPPVSNKRFALHNWLELTPFFTQNFLSELYKIEKEFRNQNGTNLPLFIGYKTIGEEIHWQAAMLEVGKFPIHGIKVEKNYYTELSDAKIHWVHTRNCSYNFFFGRGKLAEKFTDKKILLIGIGAIGSIVATTLTRGGCLNIDLIDYDVKEPENVCRSEYSFISGINNKTDDLGEILVNISPFVEVKALGHEFSEMLNYFLKSFTKSSNDKVALENFLNQYDIIFDCTSDNDLMYVLNQLQIKSQMINLSITNHADSLICGVSNYYQFIIDQLDNKLVNDLEDLYSPTGCWSPTFKASYNDITTLVQYALKHINLMFIKDLDLRNFVLKTSESNGFEIKLEQY